MISISNDFKTAIKSSSRYGRSYAKIYSPLVPGVIYPGTNYPGQIYQTDTIYDNDYLLEWEISEHIDIGKVSAKTATIKTLSNYNLRNKVVEIYGGITLADDSVEYVGLGYFIVKKPNTSSSGQETLYEASDYMIKAQQDYTSNLTYPVTLLQIAQEICDNLEITLGNDDFYNNDLSISQPPDTTGLSYRDILKWIAEASLTFCKIGTDNKLYFKTFTTSSETIDGNYYFDLQLEDLYGPINTIQLKSNKQGDTVTESNSASVDTNGETALKFTDNGFLEDIRETEISGMLTEILGTDYYPFEMKWTNWLYLEVGDIVTLQDTDDNTYETIIFDSQQKFNGALSGTIKTEPPSKSQFEYAINTDLNKLTSRKVGNDEVISRINQTPESITISANKVSLAGKTIDLTSDTITITSTNFSVDSSGNLTCENADVTGDITSSNATITGGTLDVGSNFSVDSSGNLTANDGTFTGDIYLPNGGHIVASNGLLTNLAFEAQMDSYGEFQFVGAEVTGTTDNDYRDFVIVANIPNDFTIVEAKITYTNIPVLWYDDTEGYFWGYVRSLKAYKESTMQDDYYIDADVGGAYYPLDNVSYSEMSSAWPSGYTPSVPSTPDHEVETTVSGDIKNDLDTGINRIYLRPDSLPSPEDLDDNYIKCAEQTSAGRAILNIIGYYDYD